MTSLHSSAGGIPMNIGLYQRFVSCQRIRAIFYWRSRRGRGFVSRWHEER
jgi:hypothetical protein